MPGSRFDCFLTEHVCDGCYGRAKLLKMARWDGCPCCGSPNAPSCVWCQPCGRQGCVCSDWHQPRKDYSSAHKRSHKKTVSPSFPMPLGSNPPPPPPPPSSATSLLPHSRAASKPVDYRCVDEDDGDGGIQSSLTPRQTLCEFNTLCGAIASTVIPQRAKAAIPLILPPDPTEKQEKVHVHSHIPTFACLSRRLCTFTDH